MPSRKDVRKDVTSEPDIEISDIFKTTGGGYSEYFVVTDQYSNENGQIVELNRRDGLYNVGQSDMVQRTPTEVIENIQNGQWQYWGIFVYAGEDINGKPVDFEEILTPEAYEEYQSQQRS